MEFNAHQSFQVIDRSYFNIIKREIQKLSESYGFNETRRGKIDIVVSELLSNLVKHTTNGGELLVKPVGRSMITGIEILCVDNGPGIKDTQRMMEDGVSTIGSQGEGLGAIKRLSDDFDLFSQPDIGTVIVSRIYITDKLRKKETDDGPLDIRAIMVAKPGETACGDGWVYKFEQDQYIIMAADGLGHGVNAHEASTGAIQTCLESSSDDPIQLLRQVHQEIKRTRGAVGAVALISNRKESLLFCGIGNIAGKILSTDISKSLISYNGILGHNIPGSINNHNFSWNDSSILVMHSDGLKSRWDLGKYLHVRKHDPSVIAALLYKESVRKTDDVLVIVGKNKK